MKPATKLYFVFLLSLFLTSCIFQSPQRRAQKKLTKQKYEKAARLLDKSLRKDSLNPAARYLFSQLYLDTAYQQTAFPEVDFGQPIDTAQRHILEALAELPFANKKDLRRLRKIGADSAELLAQRARVDSAAFRRAKEIHTVSAYAYFLEQYPYASQTGEAIRRRNVLAFRAAEEKNTYQAYQTFFQTYPQAAEVSEARERYEELLFIANTQTGTLDAYIRFLAQYPETPYRNRLIKNIYLLGTASHQAEQYADFISNYPKNSFTREALNQLYHLHKEKQSAASFLQNYSDMPFQDSLRQVIALEKQPFVAVLSEQQWQFMNAQGQVQLEGFDDIHPDYLCETVIADYIEVSRDMKPLVLAKNGHPILQQDYQQVEDLGFGMLRLQQNGRQGLLLKSGRQLLPPAYEQIERLGNDFFRVKEYSLQGLLTHNGQWLLEPAYDSLARLENFIMVYQDSLLAVTTLDTLLSTLQQNKSVSLNFIYEDALLADPNHLQVQNSQGQFTILNRQLQQQVPLTEGKITSFTGGWLLEQDGRYQVLDKQGQNILNATLRRAVIREPWVAYKTDSLWGLYHIGRQEATFDLFDSLTILHANILVAHTDKQQSALFVGQDTAIVDLSGTDSYRLLRAGRGQRNEANEQAYLLVKNGNAQLIYNQQGKLLIQGRYTEIVAPDNRLLLLKSAKGTAVADSSGATLLKPQYDAIGNYQNGYFATLKRSRFGLFNPYRNIHISPQYDVALRPYNDSLLIANKNSQWGLVSHDNKKVLNFAWDELQYWNDSIALARKDRKWQLVHISENKAVYGPFQDFRLIKQPHEESLAIVYTPEGYGLFSSKDGELISPAYDDLVNMGTVSEPLFYAEKRVKEAGLFVVVYLNAQGETIFKDAYPREEWLRLLCD
jgi:hypothetical protein